MLHRKQRKAGDTVYDDQLGNLGHNVVPDDSDNKIYQATSFDKFNSNVMQNNSRRNNHQGSGGDDFQTSKNPHDRKKHGQNSKPTAEEIFAESSY